MHQVARVWCGPKNEHTLCLRQPRGAARSFKATHGSAAWEDGLLRLPPSPPTRNAASVSDGTDTDDEPNDGAESGAGRNVGPQKVAIVAGGCEVHVDALDLQQSPYFAACIGARWGSADSTQSASVALPVELEGWNDSKVMVVLQVGGQLQQNILTG